jgi:hypothetical protein
MNGNLSVSGLPLCSARDVTAKLKTLTLPDSFLLRKITVEIFLPIFYISCHCMFMFDVIVLSREQNLWSVALGNFIRFCESWVINDEDIVDIRIF